MIKLSKHKYIYICRIGIGFSYKGDEVIWIYPWLRDKFNDRFESISFMRSYKSLHDLDVEWEEFIEAENRALIEPVDYLG